jgi:site-specific DNA-cytosine methylase
MAERPLYTLYKNLKAQNYDVPDDYNKFESALTRDGKGGADNRHAIYENLKAQNFDVPNTYERFYSALFEPRSKTSSRAKGGSVPMSAADRARFSAGAAAISASAQHTMNNAGRYNRLKQRKQKQQKDFGRVNLGTHQTPYGGDANNVVKDDSSYNPETGKAGAYVSSDNENVYSQPEAEQKQAVLDQQNNAYQEAVDIGEIPSVFDVRDKNGNYDLQENINKNGTYLTEEGARNQFDKKLAEAYARKKEIEALIAEDHRQHGNPLLSYGASIGASNGRTAEQSDYSNKLATSLALVKQQIGALEAVKQYPTSSWGEDALKALDNTAFTAKTWDFGLTDFATMGQMERIKTKMDNNLPLSGSDKMLLKSKLGADAAAALEDEKMGNIYRWTKIAGQSLPFMADFFLTGGYGGITKAISRGALKFAAKRGMGKVSAAILKNTGIVAGDVIGSYAMAGSEQAMKTGADIMQRHLGNLYQDEKGDYKFGTFDENGNLLHEGGESMGTALYKGLTSAMVENYTEKLFGHSYGIKKGAINFMEKHGMNASAEFFKNIGKSGWYTNSKKWMEKFGINGFGEEVMEEEIGIPLHALLDGDNKFSDLLDTKQQLDIIGGMALSVGSMYAMGAGSRPVKGVYNRSQYYRFRNKVNVADSDAQNLMGDKWADIKDKIDNTTNEQMGGVLADILRQRDTMSKDQINAAINYGINLMKMRGYNVAKTAEMNAREITNEPTTPEEQHQEDIDNAYSEGHDADDADKHDIQLEHEDQMKTLAGLLNISEQQLSAMNDDELQSLTGQNDKIDQAIYDYQLSSARYQGVTDDAQDKIDMAANQAAQRVDMYTDKSRGSVRNATVKASGGAEDYGVYIISGNIAINEDGSINVADSDDMILFYDPTTNSVEHADALRFAELGDEVPADDVKAQAVADAKEKAIKEVAGIVDGTIDVGSQFKVTGADGLEHTYEILADYGDGTAAISIDGNVVENPYSLEDLQQLKDLEDQKRLEAAKAQREQMEKERAEQQTQETEQPEETQPSLDFNQILNDNGNVVLADVLGKDGNTKYPNSQLFLIRDSGAKAKVMELKSDGTLVPHAVNKKDVRTATTMTLDEYKQAFADSSMIEDNSGAIEGGRGGIEVNDELPPVPDNVTINGDGTYSVDGAVQGGENTTAPAEQTEQTPAMTLEDGTIVPMLEDGNPDFSKLTADQTAELYDSQFGEDADSVISGWVSDAKKALDKANNMTVKGKNFVEQKAAKEAKEKAIADAQAAYDSAIAIRDAYNSRQLAKVEDTAEGRKNLIEKARRKFSRLKSAVKDDAEAVSQLYKDVVGSLLHRLYDVTGIDVTDTIPLTAEEYVASNLGAHSLNYEGTETSKGVKQETGLSREDFAKTQLLAADGKGTTIDDLVHSLWENRPSNLESLDTQDIRNALIGVLNSGFKASEARNYIENLRIAQAENILEEQKKAADNAAFAEENKAESEQQTETAPESEEKTGEENSDEINDEENEQTNENINAPETPEIPEDATDENPLGQQKSEEDLPFSARDNGTQQTTAERAADVEKNKVDDMKVVDNIVGQKTRKAFERLAKMMGANIQWQYSDKLGNGWIQETTDADGNVHRTIFITLDSSITEGAQFIFGHEMTHQIKNLNPAAYNELTQLVLDTYGSDAFDKAVDETMKRYSDAGFSGRARDYYAEEVVADAVGEMIRDLNLAHTLAMKMSHPLLAAIHEILQKIKLAFFGTEYSDVTKNIIRSIEQAYVKTANGQVTNSETGEDVSFSLRQKPEPKKKGIGYKVFVLKDGKLYPPMVANPDGAATPVGVWLDADAAPIAGESKTGRPQVKQGGKGTQGGSGKLAYRPGWHLGVVPYAIQFNRKDAEGNKTLFPKNFVFAEVEYAADVDYQEEARQEGINPSGKYQHSLAGLKHLPTDGYYMYRTNPNPETDPWVITGAMKVNRILTRAEQAELVKNAGREPQQIQEGDIVTDDVVNSINQEIDDAPKFSLKVYHGSGADFTEFDFDHMGEGAGSQVFGWGGYVTSSKKIGKSYATLMDNDPSKAYYRIQRSNGTRFAKKYPTLESFLHGDKQIAMNDKFTEQEKIDFYNEMKKLAEPYHNLYEVDIPDDNGSNYLDWDKPLSKNQQDAIREGLEHLGVGIKTLESKGQSLERTGENVYNSTLYIGLTGTEYDLPERTKGISKFLSSVGFTGIKYKAGRNFGGAKKGDTNYVIFKPEDMRITEHTKFSLKDNQGNPLNQDGTLKLDKIKSVDELTDEDFLHPTRNVELPSLPKKIADAIGTEGKPVVIKKNIFERNYMRHKDVTPELSKVIFKSALYNPDLYGQNQKKTRPYNWVLINTKDEKGNNRTVLLEVNPNKDNVEIVHWHFVNDKNLGLIKKQAIREGDQVLILPSEQSEEVGGLSNLTDDLSAAKIDNSSETAKENGEKFSLKDEKTLAGVHNISEEKLLKAIKQGGLANPSVAVIDSSKQDHKEYGGISLILPSDKIAKRTGKNAGTWQGDAYTPTYPEVEKQMSNKGAEKSSSDVLSVPKEMQHEVRNGIDRWLNGGDANSGLKYLFLHEKGNAPKMVELQHKYSDKVYNDLKSITSGNFDISSIGKADAQKVLDMYIDNVFGGDRAAYEEKQKYRIARYKKQVAEGEKNPFLLVRAKNALEQYDKYGFYFDKVQEFVRKVERDHRMTGVDTNATLNDVEDYIKTNNLTDEFNIWLEGKEKEYGIKEVIFDGFTPSGNRRYVPNTLENVSKLMKKQGRNGATGAAVSFQNFAARLMPSYGTLKDIRSKKGLLTSDREKFDKFRDKWSSVFFELGNKCQPDSTSAFDSYGMERLSEAAMTSDPQAYLKKEYNVDFSDEDTKRLKEMVKAIKEEHPAMYFETKFERPVRFDEFSAAVVPTTTKKEVKEALKNAGVSIFEYDEKSDADRSRAFNEAINSSDNIRFSLKEEKEKIVADAKANGTYMTAPNGEKTKLDAEQWATVRTANFKNWFGDWENDPENASKVVDENGEPMVVWHGRSAEFNTFEKKEGVRFIMGLEDKVKAEGFFFSPDKGLAEEFASNSSRHRGGKANVVPCFLNIRRPMDLTGEDYDRIYEDVTGWEYMVGMDTQDNLWGIMDEEGMADKIKEKGYDGAIFVEEVDDSYEPTKISYCALDANQIKSAENNNGDFSADNNDIRFSLAGERGAAAADKAEERTARMDNLSVARKMEEEKKDAKAIKMATGWERGADGKWRYEMPDAMIKDTMDVGGGHIVKRYEDDMLWNGGKLSRVIDAPELFKAYPQLKDVRIETDAIMNDMPSNGEYNAKTNTITIHADELKYMNSILNHEIQHAIQSIEGFDRGGSPRLVRGEIKKRLAEVTKQIRQLRAEGKEDEAKAIVEKNRGLYNAYQANDDYNSYKSLAGEVEARNVQERMNMTPEERRRTLAESTEDVARKDQIFLGVGDVSFSLRDMADGKESGAADMAEDLKSLNTPDEVDDAIKTAIDDMPSGWQMANKKMVHIAQALGENRKAEIAGDEPKFSLKDGTLIKAGTYFSGGGLVEEGLKGIIDPVVAVEYDEKISGVYRNNFGQHIVTADVRDVDPKELVKQIDGEVEYFHASPVCKNYSQAKSNHAEVELDKETAASTAEFINAIKPKVVTIENVKGYKDSEAMKTITDALDANGYTWDADVYNAADYGGYTNRERLIVRAVRDGKLPEKPKKMAHKSGWYEAVADIIPTLTEKKNGVAPWMDVRLKADGIDWRNIDKPLYVMGSAYADGKIPHAFADELLPTLRTKSGDVIVMPDGKVYRAMGRVLARVSGVSDDYKMPFSENLSHTIIGNGIPTQLTEHVIAPLLTGSDPKFSIRTYHGTGASFDKFDLSHALEGEGSESFGHGVYVTNSSKIGREYAQRAKNRKMEDLYKNMRYPDGVKGDIFKRRVFGEMVNDVATGGSVASAKEFAKKRVGADANDIQRTLENLKDREKGTEYEQNLKNRLAEYKEGLKWIDSLNEDYLTQGNANRYDVDIPDDNGSNYLDWEGTIPDSLDKQKVAEDAYKVVSDNQGFNDFKATPLNDFIAHTLKTYVNTTDVAGRVEKLKSDIKDVIENYVADDDVLALNEYLKDATPDDVLATIWYNDLVRDINDADLGEELYRKLSTYVGDNAASQILSDNGLVGIKYPAGMIHGGAKEGDYNYVIFDENNANIVGNTRYSLRYDQFEHDLNQWKKDNNLPKDAQRPTIPQRNAGESAVDFLRRVDEYRKMMALWKTAPTYEQHLLSDDTALGEFNRELQRGSVLKRIAFQDSMLAIRKAQEAIMKEVGVDRLNMAEDAYTAENRSHGKGKNEFEEYNNEFLQPLRKAYHQMKKVLGNSYDNVRVYMMAKHGLERDAQMAFKKSLEADYEDVNQRSAAYKAYKNDLDRVTNDADLEFGRVDFTTWRQKDNALRGKYSPSYMDYRYDDNGIAYDYSGLSSLFDGSDFEEAAHKLVRDVETKHLAEVQALWNATNAATKKILRDGFKAGMMSKDAYEYVKGMYSHYIPLRGWDGTTADQVWDYIGGGKGAFNQTLKTAHGRTSIADDPIAYIENMAESGILLNNKNWVKQHLMLLAQNHLTSLLTLSKAWYVKSTDANGNEEWIPATPQITSQMNSNQVKAAINAFEQKMEQLAQTGDATKQRDGLNIAYPQTHSEEREHEVRVMKDGEEYVIYVNGDPQLAQAMNNTRAHRVREIQSGKLDRAAAWLGRKMAAAYTSLSPLFIPSNYFRDLTMTLASTAIREDGRYNYLLIKNLATSWNLGFMLREYQNGKLREKVSNGNATPKEQMFYDFMMNGGETGFVSSLDVEDLKKKFKNDLKDLDRWKANPVKVGHTIMDGIEFLNRMIEDSNRFAVYMTSIQYGRSIDEAVNDAKDVTLNFNRKGTGEYGWQMIRNLYLFINPAVQSLQTLGALVKHHPFKFTAVTAAWLASGVLVPIVNAALMSLLGGDDDKDKYWQFSKWDRRNNAIMWIPFTNEYVKIPLAQEFRAFYGIGDMIASKMMGGELAEETWSQYAEDLLGQVVDMLPLDPTGYDGNIAVSLMPNPIRPVFELAFNVDFTGKPLFKETEYNKYDPNFTKAYVGTPDWLVRVSKMVNSIGNDYPDVQQNAIDAFGDPRYNLNNPAVVDHVLSSYLGGAYTMGSQVLGVLTKSLNDPKEIKMADIPLVSKFVSNPDDRPVTKKQGDEFWNMKENHDRAANTLSKLKKQAKVDGDYSILERFYGSEEYKQYKQEDVKVKKYEEDKKKERADESGEEYRPHKLNAEDIYKAHATPKDDFEDLKLKQLFTKLNGFKTSYDLLVDTAPGQSDGYYNTNKTAIDAIDEISLDKQEISELKKGFLEDGKDAYNAEDMKRIRELRKRILSVLEPANKVVVANQKAKAEKK